MGTDQATVRSIHPHRVVIHFDRLNKADFSRCLDTDMRRTRGYQHENRSVIELEVRSYPHASCKVHAIAFAILTIPNDGSGNGRFRLPRLPVAVCVTKEVIARLNLALNPQILIISNIRPCPAFANSSWTHNPNIDAQVPDALRCTPAPDSYMISGSWTTYQAPCNC